MQGGGGPADPVPYLLPSHWTKKKIRVNAVQFAIEKFGLRLALNATARACNQERGLACRALDSAQGKPCSVALLGLAFTMAEILLSLTIIGVVAAITLPSLTGNINERTWNTQRKALYARMSQAIALMPALNGYGTLTEETDSAGSTSIEDTAAETFVADGLAKVLKINNICDNEHLADCGIPEKIITLDGEESLKRDVDLNTLVNFNSAFQASFVNVEGTLFSYSQIDTKSVAFETQNGESILLFYNPDCRPSMGETAMYYSQPKMCVNMVYDLNNSKGPNTVGKDIGFLSVLYPSDSVVVAPVPLKIPVETTHYDFANTCKEHDSESRVPNVQETISLFYNQKLLNAKFESLWSSSIYSEDLTKAWLVHMGLGYVNVWPRTSAVQAICVKR